MKDITSVLVSWFVPATILLFSRPEKRRSIEIAIPRWLGNGIEAKAMGRSDEGTVARSLLAELFGVFVSYRSMEPERVSFYLHTVQLRAADRWGSRVGTGMGEPVASDCRTAYRGPYCSCSPRPPHATSVDLRMAKAPRPLTVSPLDWEGNPMAPQSAGGPRKSPLRPIHRGSWLAAGKEV